MIAGGTWNTGAPSIAAAGALAVAWPDGRDARTARAYVGTFDAALADRGAQVALSAEDVNVGVPSIDWSGSVIGVAWEDIGTADAIRFARADASGTPIGAPVVAAASGGTPILRASAGGWGILWAFGGSVSFARLDASGAPLGMPASIGAPAIDAALVATPDGWAAAWSEPGADSQLRFARIDASGAVGAVTSIGSASGSSAQPSIAWTGAGFVVAWTDWRDGNAEIYAVALDGAGAASGMERRLTAEASSSERPQIAWNGREAGLVWIDARDGDRRTFFAALDASGAMLEPETAITPRADSAAIAWIETHWVLAWHDGLRVALVPVCR